MKTKFYDWLWWNIGFHLWRCSARNHEQPEVKHRLNWMTLDCVENADTKEGIEWRRKNLPLRERQKRDVLHDLKKSDDFPQLQHL